MTGHVLRPYSLWSTRIFSHNYTGFRFDEGLALETSALELFRVTKLHVNLFITSILKSLVVPVI